MQYQVLNVNSRWFRFTGRRLQVAKGGTYIDLITLRSGAATSIHQAMDRFNDRVKAEGFESISAYLKYSKTQINDF
ncbi:hypothetical protein NPJ88_000250 [Halomonas elongata]|uniref:hypothetical protein n=1 Tax=Halomonas elongata TaxID=2746 RepID=UPI00255B361F|nr:hypothetical protein [Halomonas elongata]MDL4860753.1 hypothetical protein [Halomonas elongata]